MFRIFLSRISFQTDTKENKKKNTKPRTSHKTWVSDYDCSTCVHCCEQYILKATGNNNSKHMVFNFFFFYLIAEVVGICWKMYAMYFGLKCCFRDSLFFKHDFCPGKSFVVSWSINMSILWIYYFKTMLKHDTVMLMSRPQHSNVCQSSLCIQVLL